MIEGIRQKAKAISCVVVFASTMVCLSTTVASSDVVSMFAWEYYHSALAGNVIDIEENCTTYIPLWRYYGDISDKAAIRKYEKCSI